MSVKLTTGHYLEFLSLKGGCKGSSESTHVKMPHCWKSHVTANMVLTHQDASNKNHTTVALLSEKIAPSEAILSVIFCRHCNKF